MKLSEALYPKEALAIDVMNHPSCWRDNVDHVLCTKDGPMTQESSKFAAEFSAKIEFFTLLRGLLDDGYKVSIGDVQKGYERIRPENKVMGPSLPRRTLKRMLLDTFDDFEFHQPKRVNEPELISSKKLRDMAIDDYDDKFEPEKRIECIYSAAKILRKAIYIGRTPMGIQWHIF